MVKQIVKSAFFGFALMIALTAARAVAEDTAAETAKQQSTDEAAQQAAPQAEEKKAAPKIEMAILLDTSGSMSGLINQARTQLWKIVNEFATAERGGQRPELKVALYEYGKQTLPAEEHWIRMIVPLTDDLDKVSEELFALNTNGGEEYCGAVIQRATQELNWSKAGRPLKCIFIAGNEPFTQGPIDYKKACAEAAGEGITVSTIHCGDHNQGVSTKWADGAKLADGSYMSINQEVAMPEIKAPQDAELAKLNAEINKTYIAYGAVEKRKEAAARQIAQDTNAKKANIGAFYSRIQFKGSKLYSNPRWDLCDAYCQGKVKLEDLTEDQLPEELKKMKPEERKAYIEKMVKQRKELQEKVKSLASERAKYVAAEQKKTAASVDNTLDKAIIDAAHTAGSAAGFSFGN